MLLIAISEWTPFIWAYVIASLSNVADIGNGQGMFAAHRFYEKNGFVELAAAQLPPNFPMVYVDSKFYCCELTGPMFTAQA